MHVAGRWLNNNRRSKKKERATMKAAGRVEIRREIRAYGELIFRLRLNQAKTRPLSIIIGSITRQTVCDRTRDFRQLSVITDGRAHR